MEQTKNEPQLAPNMIMCGDHPSVTKTELNAKETKPEDRERDIKKLTSYGRITPTASHTRRRAASRERGEWAERGERLERLDGDGRGNRTLVHAAIGSFRWPPYLLCVWVLVLVLTHLLHCIVGLLEKALPALRQFCQYFRAWTESSWKSEADLNQRVCPIALACVTGALYALYCALYVLYSVAVWAIEPLCSDMDEIAATEAPKVIDYTDEVNSKNNLNLKQ